MATVFPGKEISPITEKRRKRLLRFYDFLVQNKDKYPLSQLLALYGVLTGLHPETVYYYIKQLTEANVVKVEKDRVVSVADLK